MMNSDTKFEVLDRVRDFLEAMSVLSMRHGVYLETSGYNDNHPAMFVEDAEGNTIAWVDFEWLDFMWSPGTKENGGRLSPRGYAPCLADADVKDP